MRLPTQSLEPFQIRFNLMFTVEAVVIVGTQVTVWNIVLEEVPDYREDGVGTAMVARFLPRRAAIR